MDPSRRELLGALPVVLADDDRLKTLEQQVAVLTEALNRYSRLMPLVGTVVAFVGDWPPAGPARDKREQETGWLECDGRPLPQNLFPELVPLLPKGNLPDLRNRVVRGAAGGNRGAAGGKDEVELTTVAAPGHTHGLPDVTGSISNNPKEIGKHSYYARDNNKGWKSPARLTTEDASSEEGQHRHDLGGSTEAAGGHTHSVTVPTVPAFVAAHFLIRFRSAV